MDAGKKQTRGSFTFKIEQTNNGTFVASILHSSQQTEPDDVGALYYVIVVIFLYGCSILMMIASYIRKNNVDRKLNRYLKDMATVRKREQQLQLFNAAAKAAAQTRKSMCLGGMEPSLDDQKWSGASHWSRINEEILLEERRRGSMRRVSSIDSTEDESPRKSCTRGYSIDSADESLIKPSDQSEVEQDTDLSYHCKVTRVVSVNPSGKSRSTRPSIRIISETSDPESDNEAFFTDMDDDSGSPQMSLKTMGRSQIDIVERQEHSSPNLVDEHEAHVSLLDQDDPDFDDAQVTEDSESDLYLGKHDQDSRKIQWLDFQVISSV